MTTRNSKSSLHDNAMLIVQHMLSTRKDGQDWNLSDIENKLKNTVADPIGVMRYFPAAFHLKLTTKSVDLKCPIDVCIQHWAADGCEGNCRKLHICKFFVLGTCRRNAKCKFGHFLKQDHNLDLLTRAKIDSLDLDELRCLISKSLSFKRKGLPNICIHHNRPNGCRQKEEGAGCPYMHICERFLKYNTCAYHDDYCRYSHDVTKPQVKEILYDFGYDLDLTSATDVLKELRDRYSRFSRHRGDSASLSSQSHHGSHESLASASSGEPESILKCAGGARPKDTSSASKTPIVQKKEPSQPISKEEICAFHLAGKCKYKEKCVKLHTPLPYLWQFYDRDKRAWLTFADKVNHDVEKIYCDPANDGVPLYFGQKPVQLDFASMSYQAETEGQLRRLSTPSYVHETRDGHFSTEWVWFWLNEHRAWQEYPDGRAIEQAFLDGENSYEFSAGSQQYVLHLKEMFQENVRYGTTRLVRRRPKLFAPKPKDMAEASSDGREQIYPDTWNISRSGDADSSKVKLALLHGGSAEFAEVARHFHQTMHVPITAVYRVQNPELWDEYIRKKQKMTKKLKGTASSTRLTKLVNSRSEELNERLLFHGTKMQFIEPIFKRDGFDSRDAGKSVGTRLGKGSYFAREASYSACYTDCNTLFVAKVLVGKSALGERSYTKPPPLNAWDESGELHDSCVNDVEDPSIFVTFENRQSYPAYLVQYESPANIDDHFKALVEMGHDSNRRVLDSRLNALC